MLYNWQCAKCEQLTEVNRPVSRIDTPPESCEHCNSTQFSKRVIVRDNPKVKGFILADTGVGWPGHGFYSKKG